MRDNTATITRHILVVDDEPTVCDAIRMMLEHDAHKVETAKNGEEALAIFENGKFDVVFTDFIMSGMNGHELATRIKALVSNQPIIMISAYADMFLVGEALPNIDLLIGKPFRLATLREAISKVCG